MSANKTELRKHYLARRRSQLAAARSHAAIKACLKTARHPWFKQATSIGFYWPNKSEISPLPLLKMALQQGKQCYLPRVISSEQMTFHLFHKRDHLQPDRYGLAAPRAQRSQIAICKIQLLIVPLVAFARDGTRLGMGGGFYDRALSSCSQKPRCIGLAYSQQLAQSLPREPWDIKLDAIASEKSFYTCQLRSRMKQ